ncbi:MAG: hypothetical protein EBX15_05495, partial [Acidimicrobiia bacterium]|nr:hypothetical protein [Acidimicrobiia bacterium]
MAVSPAVVRSRLETLARITAHRQALQAVIDDVAAGRLSLVEVFRRAAAADHDDASRQVYLVKLAEVLPAIGKVRARRVLADHGLGERTRVGDVPVAVQQSLCETLS